MYRHTYQRYIHPKSFDMNRPSNINFKISESCLDHNILFLHTTLFKCRFLHVLSRSEINLFYFYSPGDPTPYMACMKAIHFPEKYPYLGLFGLPIATRANFRPEDHCFKNEPNNHTFSR